MIVTKILFILKYFYNIHLHLHYAYKHFLHFKIRKSRKIYSNEISFMSQIVNMCKGISVS